MTHRSGRVRVHASGFGRRGSVNGSTNSRGRPLPRGLWPTHRSLASGEAAPARASRSVTRGFDVYAFSSCSGAACVSVPLNTPGEVHGGGQAVGELAELTILEGTAPGDRAQFSFDASYVLGAPAPTGTVQFRDRETGVRVDATTIDTLTIEGPRATLTGRATVDGVAGVRFVLEIEDLGKANTGADTFRLVTGTGYGAFGVVDRGNITVSGGGLLGS